MEKLPRLPDWLKQKSRLSGSAHDLRQLLSQNHIRTVCQQSRCPNITECFEKKTPTFMILGKNCTRLCSFCNVTKEKPEDVSSDEPENIAKVVEKLNLNHVIITSVTRDDLGDGGANHFAETIRQVRLKSPKSTIEVLTPDFKGDKSALDKVIDAKPDIFAHNIETVERLYPLVRPQASYSSSLYILKYVKEQDRSIFAKSGFMVGLGENKEEIFQTLNDLRENLCNMVTIGQYLRPTLKNTPVVKYITPEEFKAYENFALSLGFVDVKCGPLVRSSYKSSLPKG